MVLKPADLLNQLPSVSELLEKPPVRALAARWNRSVVAGRVRSFLDEMRAELQRRTDEVSIPSARELAERAARYVLSQQHRSLGSAINASGQLRSATWAARPLSDAAMESMVAVGREFVLRDSAAGPTAPADVERLLCRLTGAAAAAVVHSYSGALWLALSTFTAQRAVLVARAEVGEIDAAAPLPQLAAAAGAKLQEVGTINRASIDDYRALASSQAAAILKLWPDDYQVVGDTSIAEVDQLARLCRDWQAVLIEALGAAPLADPPEPLGFPLRSAHGSLASGADLTLLRGDGLVGGPPCGILLGQAPLIERITRHPIFAAWRLDIARSAALGATLEYHENRPNRLEQLPIWQFLTVPVENLRNRAERMAPQLAHAEGIGSSTAVETRSPLFSALPDGCPSYGVALTAAEGDVRSLEERLRDSPLPIIGRVEGDRVILDLRTVMPRQDKLLVDSLLGAQMAMQPPPVENSQTEPSQVESQG